MGVILFLSPIGYAVRRYAFSSAVGAALVALAVAALTATAVPAHAQAPPAGPCPALLDREFNRLQTGNPESLCQYRGKVLLVVNTASYCGYTHQYEGLEALYRKYRDRGLVVLGFPSNDFGAQEPGSNHEIAEFCRLTYGVQFPMFEKASVTSLKTNPLYADLAARTGQSPRWNFHKYLIDRNGNAAGTFASDVEPDSRQLLALVEKLLADKPASQKG
ncbi:MAG: glutathione peroxidase [Pseudomonadota bacterium]|nr:glutathione peroxidase [Pseudomonadota bacterium]